MMTVFRVLAVIAVCSQVEAQSESGSLQKVALGDTLRVSCPLVIGKRTVVWYKLDTNRKLQLLESANPRGGHKIQTNDRYSVQFSESGSTLSVSGVMWEDGGTYFCGVMTQNQVQFADGTVVEVEGDQNPIQSVQQKPDCVSAQPGDSVTLNCSFNISHCPQEHTSVTWRKNSSDWKRIRVDSENDGNTCQHMVSKEALCVHNLTLKNVSSTDDGTYLCVVTACGDTQLGSGTRIHLFNKKQEQCGKDESGIVLSPVVLALSGLSSVLGVAVLVLASVICRNHRKQAPGLDCEKESLSRMDPADGKSDENKEAEDGVVYAGVNVVSKSTTSTCSMVTPAEEATVYSHVATLQKD